MARIRLARPDDAEAIAEIYAPYVRETAISFEIDPPGAAEMRRRMDACLAAWPWLVAEEQSRVLGYVYAGRFHLRAAYDWSAEITAYLAPEAQRRGLGTAMYRVLIDLLRAQGYHAVFAGITLPNPASLAIHRALGMEEVGTYRESGFKFGRWHDVMWMGMTISPSVPPLHRPTAFPDLTRPLDLPVDVTLAPKGG